MYARMQCGSGTGQFRVIATCDPNTGHPYSVYGNWGTPGLKASRANCKGADYLITYDIEYR